MANTYKDIDEDKLQDLAAQYIVECEGNKKEYPTVKGDIVNVTDRKIADWKYFVSHWLVNKGFDFYTREYSYEVEKDENHPLSYTIKKIKARMDGYSGDVVANEGKGIFWAKNRLGMTDKSEQTHKSEVSPFNPFNIDVPTDNSTG
jgi:hypothetical protein